MSGGRGACQAQATGYGVRPSLAERSGRCIYESRLQRYRLADGHDSEATHWRRMRNRQTPALSDAFSNWWPVALQKAMKSLGAAGSVATTSRTAPGGIPLRAFLAFRMGRGQESPLVSRMVSAVTCRPLEECCFPYVLARLRELSRRLNRKRRFRPRLSGGLDHPGRKCNGFAGERDSGESSPLRRPAFLG